MFIIKSNLLIYKIWLNISRKRKLQLIMAFIIMILSGLAEIISLAAIVPFLTAITNPEVISKNELALKFFNLFNINPSDDILLPLTIIFCSAVVISAVIRLLNILFINKLSAAIGSDISCEAFKRTIYQPYQVHINRNSSEVIAALTNHTRSTIEVINFTLQLFAGLIIAISILITLITIDWSLALSSISIFAVAYYLISITIRKRLNKNSKNVAKKSKIQIKLLQESLGAIRNVLLSNSQQLYLNDYKKIDRNLWQTRAENQFLGLFPRYAIEALGLLFIAFLSIFVKGQNNDSLNIIPILGTFALGAQRLLPAMQQIYIGWARIKSVSYEVNELINKLEQPMPFKINANFNNFFNFKDSIKLEKICFSYKKDIKILQDISLEIKQGERIGIVGTTGSGKSSLVDIILGLLKPDSGIIRVDGQEIYDPKYPDRIRKWQQAIANVPQDIYLSDCSFKENIAFCVPKNKIDIKKVKESARKARILEFIEKTPLGFDTLVGEMGIQLSGGQKQRIGIARALYQQKNILFLDEATSALDNKTESLLIESINNLNRKITIVMIAHRVSTIKNCDKVVHLENGKINKVTSGYEM